MTPFHTTAVEAIFDSYPSRTRARLLALRELIFKTAAATPGVGPLQETLKWGEPAYVTAQSRSGSTLRIACKPSNPLRYRMCFICTTSLIEDFRRLFPDDFCYEGNRAIVFDVGEPVPMEALAVCVEAALTYRLKRGGARRT
jgi:hypothetical protein